MVSRPPTRIPLSKIVRDSSQPGPATDSPVAATESRGLGAGDRAGGEHDRAPGSPSGTIIQTNRAGFVTVGDTNANLIVALRFGEAGEALAPPLVLGRVPGADLAAAFLSPDGSLAALQREDTGVAIGQ